MSKSITISVIAKGMMKSVSMRQLDRERKLTDAI